jgi:acetoin utilization deacetylase AcuC-like enzyme
VAINLGGGSHHAGRSFARGYCLFNDIALACDAMRGAGLARRALVVDCDVHQGDGTADLLAADPDAFTLSLHGARNYPFRRIPSDLDIDLSSGTTDTAYLTALDGALATALRGDGFDIAFYLAGADPWEGDRLGSLALTKPGLRRRDVLVLDVLRGQRISVCVVLAGGYAPEVHDIVDIHVATTEEVAARTIDLATRSPGRVRRERDGEPRRRDEPHAVSELGDREAEVSRRNTRLASTGRDAASGYDASRVKM